MTNHELLEIMALHGFLAEYGEVCDCKAKPCFQFNKDMDEIAEALYLEAKWGG